MADVMMEWVDELAKKVLHAGDLSELGRSLICDQVSNRVQKVMT